MSWNIKTPGDYINGPLTVAGSATITGVATFAAGTVSLPALTTTGDTDTGIYYPAANTFAVTTGGTERFRANSFGFGVGLTPINGNGKFQVLGGIGYDGQFDIISQFSDVTTAAAKGVLIGYNNTTNNGIIASAYGNGTEGLTFWTHNGSAWGQRMELNYNGNLGLGIAPSAWGASTKGLSIGGWASLAQIGGSAFFGFNSYASTTSQYNYINNGAIALGYQQGTSGHLWYTAPVNAGAAGANATFTQAMTLDASGNLLVGTPSLIFGTAAGSLNIAAANTQQFIIRHTGSAAGEFWRQAVDPVNTFYILNNATAGVSIASGATSWSAVSDERLKDIIEPISNAIEKVGSLRSVIGKYKNDETNIRRSFLIAQDVQSVLPEAVDSSKPNELGLRYTEVIPLLVAAIKELTAEVNALKNA